MAPDRGGWETALAASNLAFDETASTACNLAFEEAKKGTLEIGKLADITVLSKDILTVPEGEIMETKVVYTIVGGKIKYETITK